MILDRLADLKPLAESASSTASTSNVDAAFADIEARLAAPELVHRTRPRPAPGHSSSWTGRTHVRRRDSEADARALDVRIGATDEELAAYASAGADARGSLVAVTRQAQALRGSLA